MTEFFKNRGLNLSSREQRELTDRTIEEIRSGQPSFWGEIIKANMRNKRMIQLGKGDPDLPAETEAVSDALENAFGDELPGVIAVIRESRRLKRFH